MKNKFQIAMTLAVILAMVVTSLALADNVTPDNDFVAGGNQGTVNLGNVAPGATLTPQVSFTLVCAGNNHVDNAQSVSIAFTTSGSTAGVSATTAMIGASSGSDLGIPSGWPDDGNNNCSGQTPINDNGNSVVTFTAPTAPGPYTYTAKFNATPTPAGNNDPSSISGSVSVTFTFTVVTNTAPSISVTGVTHGASYNKGSVPTAICDVTDAEDNPADFGANLSAITGTYAADGIGSQTASCSYTDIGGLTANASATYSIVDPSAPSIGYVLTPSSPDGNNGWYKSNVTLVWSVTDPESTVTKIGCVDQNITTDQNATTYSCSASSAGGSATQVNVTIKRDASAPSISATPSPTANANNWNNTDVTVSYSCTDNGPSGVDAGASDLGNDLLTASGTASGTCVDMAGNSAGASYTAQIDKVKPVITGSRLPLANTNDWNNTDVVVSFICTDSGGSGIDTNTVTGTTLTNEGAGQSATNTGTCTDKAGNTADSATVSGINIDKTVPTISAAIFAGTSGLNGWYVSDVTVRFTCNDTGGSGLLANACPVDQVLSAEGAGISSIAQTVTDAAGNTSDLSNVVTVNIDKTKPTISAAISAGTSGSNGWYVSDVTVHFTCNDTGGSGIPADTCPADQILSAEGTNISSTAQTVTDAAGNTSDPSNVIMVNIDKTVPGVSCGSADGVWHADNVNIACTANDGISGLANAADANFSLATTVPVGVEDANASTNDHTVFDMAGNSAIAGPVSGNMIDKKTPQLAGCDASDGVWHANNVTLYCHYTDGGSGPSTQDVALTTNVAAGTETNNAFASASGAQACDAVGNCAASPADIGGNMIDKKAPAITITTPANGASYLLNQVVVSNFNCVDGGSGVATCSGLANVDTSTTGSKTFTVNATDAVGNSNSASTTYSVAFKICALYDQTKSHKSGSTVPLKLQLCDVNGVNYSSASIEVKAISVKKVDNTASGILDDSGAANSPEMNFRYDASLGGSGGYIFNLSTKGLTTGTWKVTFTVNGASDLSYFVRFDVK